MNKSFQELDLSNAFLFGATAQDPEACRLIVKIATGRDVQTVSVHAEHSVLFSSDFRSVRLDVYGTDETDVNYNVEAQNRNEKNLPKRSRYHQAELDVSALKPGEDFNNLKPSYIIFICTFDPFNQGLYRYTFEERCKECDMGLGDETCKIFLNTKGNNEKDVPKELVQFLKYMENSTDEFMREVTEKSVIELHKKVTEVKKNRELEEGCMTGEELLRSSRAEGKAQGIVEGRAQGIVDALILVLNRMGTISEDVNEKIHQETDLNVLMGWLELAAGVQSIEQFRDAI